jgi:hypothetical protein
VRLRPSIEPDDVEIDDLDLSYIDDDPLNFFLTPAPSSQDDDIDMMDFDAGIENSKRPAPVVRSISPSNLDGGLHRLPLRPPTPPRTAGSLSPEPELDMAPTPEDDGESYLHFGSSPATPPFTLPFSLKDFATARSKARKESSKRTPAAALLAPTPMHGSTSSGRGRLSHRPGPRPLGASLDAGGRSRTWSGRLSPRAWREPSPDVWSIEEETEEDLTSEMGGSAVSDAVVQTRPINILAAKPKKRVRFVLPVQEVVD